MALLDFEFTDQALHFPALRMWFDAHRKRRPGELVFVSHAHSDHTGRHAEVILTRPTQLLMAASLGGKRTEHVLNFGERVDLREARFGSPREASLTLYPAGHILGSAMARIESNEGSLLYTGDFKLRPGKSAELCQPIPADVLVMETTFGLPKYVFPPTCQVVAEMLKFCAQSLAEKTVPVLLGYSLGKSQEMLSLLAHAGFPLMAHEATAQMTGIYSDLGWAMPSLADWAPENASGHIVLAPPGAALDALRKLHVVRLGVVTGWAIDSSCRYRYRADAAFPLSDHADFPDLIEFVRRVSPRTIFTLHGFAGEFAATLRRLGYDARSLTDQDQFELALGDGC